MCYRVAIEVVLLSITGTDAGGGGGCDGGSLHNLSCINYVHI
jgi:hypothetical protein